jgi:hypothetical protein
MLNGSSLEEKSCSFEANDVFNAFPVLGKPGISVGTTGDVTVFEPPMTLRPGLSLLEAPPSRRVILKQISTVLVQGGLIVFGQQEIVPCISMDLRTHCTLGMHRIQSADAPCDQLRRQQRLEGTDLILFLLYLAVPSHDTGGDLITVSR